MTGAARAEIVGRIHELSQRVGLGLSEDNLDEEFRQLLADGESLTDQYERDETLGRILSLRADHERHLGRALTACELHEKAGIAFERAGNVDRARLERAFAEQQAVAAGRSLDPIVDGLRATVGAAEASVERAASAARLARITADLGDHYETRALVRMSAEDLVALGFPDPAGAVERAFREWERRSPPDDVAGLRVLTQVIVTWLEVLGLRARVGDAESAGDVRALALLAGADIGSNRSRVGRSRLGAGRSIDRSLRLSDLQNEFGQRGPVPAPEQVERMLRSLQEICDDAVQQNQPLEAVAAKILAADVLTWAVRTNDAEKVLVEAEAVANGAENAPPTSRTWSLVQIARRRMQIAASAGDHSTVSVVASVAIGQIEEQRDRLSLPYLEDSQLRDLWMVYSLGVGAARALGDWDLLLERADRLKARGAMSWLDAPVREVRNLRKQLADDEAVIYWFWAARHRLLVLTIDTHQVTCELREMSVADRTTIDAIAADIAELSGAAPWLEDAVSEVSDLVMPSAGALPLRGKKRVFVSPHGVLHGLPLHAFAWGGKPLIDAFTLSYLPNFRALTPRHPAATGPVVVVGVSDFADGSPALPSAVEEAVAVAAFYDGADLLDGPRATTTALRTRASDGRLQRARMLHLATHGEDGPREDPLAAQLSLADGTLWASEIRGWRLNAELVVLSACWSSQRAVVGRDGADLFADEMYGLQSAFFAAGARRVVGSLWPARDSAAAETMTLFHAACSSGTLPDEALRSAMLAVRSRRPLMYDWAPYQLISLGR